jgi:glycerol-3-phosphate acyltransferase PlsX
VKTLLILVDAMGGDNAPDAIVHGCIDAINCQEGFDISLIGDSEQINKIINHRKFSNSRLKVVHANEVITNDDVPTKAIKNKKESSMVVGFNLLKEKKGDVFISSGNSGALLTGALLILGRIKGVDRPALGAVLPTKTGKALLIDAGLNSTCKPINYLQFGVFGKVYMQALFNIDNPKVGLLNMGTEEKKGSDILKQAYELLSSSDLNFVGNIEGKDLPEGKVDVAVCDGYVGNVVLKFLEGTGSYFFSLLKDIFGKTILSKLSFLLIKKELKELKKSLDAEENGGAPILGVNGIVMKSHGSSNDRTIRNVVIKAYNLAKNSVFEKLQESLENLGVETIE